MNVLHYSFSLSACPKCHLLICQHTSLAALNFDGSQTEPHGLESPCQERSSHGTNVYMFASPSPDMRHSWTTFGTDSCGSTCTLQNASDDHHTVFADENRVHSSLLLTTVLDPIDRTQSERASNTVSKLSSEFTQSSSYSTIFDKSSSLSRLNYAGEALTILLVLLSFLLTNTVDIVLLYIYSHTHHLYLISFVSTIILCEMIFWMRNLLEWNNRLSCLLLIPFVHRFHLLYELIELQIVALDRRAKRRISDSASTDHLSAFPARKQRLFHELSLFYLVHTGLFALIGFYSWSHNFQLSSQASMTMDYFIPRWTADQDSESSTFRRRFNGIELSVSSSYVLASIVYYLVINYSILSTWLVQRRALVSMIPSIIARFLLTITRFYSFLFLFHLDPWWLPVVALIVHLVLTFALLSNHLKYADKRNSILLQLIFSLFTPSVIDDLPIHAFIALENVGIFLFRLYFELFSFDYSPTTVRLIMFLSILISIQILGFISDVLSKTILHRTKKTKKQCSPFISVS